MNVPIFVISLKNQLPPPPIGESPLLQQNRRQQIQSQFKKYNIPFTLFDAVDGRQGLPPEYEQMVDRELAYNRIYRYLSDGEIGCALSHHLVYKHILDNNIEHAIIMEDDAILTDDFKTFIDNTVYKTCGADMVFLYHSCANAKKYLDTHYDIQYYSLKNSPNGAVAYYITHSVAKALHKGNTPISHYADFPVDVVKMFTVQAVHPRIVQHPLLNDIQSVIGYYRYNQPNPNKVSFKVAVKSKIPNFIWVYRNFIWVYRNARSLNLSPHVTGNQISPPSSRFISICRFICIVMKKISIRFYKKITGKRPT